MVWKTIGRWIMLAVAVPLAAAGVRKAGQAVEARRGRTRVSRLLGRSADVLHRAGGRSRRRRWR